MTCPECEGPTRRHCKKGPPHCVWTTCDKCQTDRDGRGHVIDHKS